MFFGRGGLKPGAEMESLWYEEALKPLHTQCAHCPITPQVGIFPNKSSRPNRCFRQGSPESVAARRTCWPSAASWPPQKQLPLGRPRRCLRLGWSRPQQNTFFFFQTTCPFWLQVIIQDNLKRFFPRESRNFHHAVNKRPGKPFPFGSDATVTDQESNMATLRLTVISSSVRVET